jgi:ATP-dependent DNA helicase DinG
MQHEGLLGSESATVLGEDGAFARSLEDFRFRPSQLEMAEAIETSITERSTLLAESGTGTGKTFAYLVPALLSGKKILISTGTKHLQEQLFHRDIPTVLSILEHNAKVSLLKGRANYLCLHRLQQTRMGSQRLEEKLLDELSVIQEWLPRTRSGDIAELSDIEEGSRVWPQVTSTVDNCIGQNCSFFEDCYVNLARKSALSSEVVVINHHLFFADKALKEDGFGSLLPEVDCIIFDEAHQIPDIATNFLGRSFSSWQILELVTDTRAAELQEKSLISTLVPAADDLAKLAADFRLSLGLDERRISWIELTEELPALPKKLSSLADALSDFAEVLEPAAAVGEALARCHERAQDLAMVCQQLASGNEDDSMVRWLEIARRTFRVHETPLNIGQALNGYFGDTKQARIFTSATLSVGGDFSHFQQSVGVGSSALTATWDSPFDYFEQAVLYVPEGLPEPRDPGFGDAIFEAILPVLQASRGRAFILFTSYRIMQQLAELLREQDDSEFLVLVQGETSKRELLHSFVTEANAVLLGTMSFWEGVDVPGSRLSTVIIDKLPFESPYEPVLKARLRALQEAGENPFMNYQVPKAVTTLRQGAGR